MVNTCQDRKRKPKSRVVILRLIFVRYRDIYVYTSSKLIIDTDSTASQNEIHKRVIRISLCFLYSTSYSISCKHNQISVPLESYLKIKSFGKHINKMKQQKSEITSQQIPNVFFCSNQTVGRLTRRFAHGCAGPAP